MARVYTFDNWNGQLKYGFTYEEREFHYYIELLDAKKYRVYRSRWPLSQMRLKCRGNNSCAFIYEIKPEEFYKIVYEIGDKQPKELK